MFNLKKHSDLSNAPNEVLDGVRDVENDLQDQVSGINPEQDSDNFKQQNLNPEEERLSDMIAAQSALAEMSKIVNQYPPSLQGILESLPAYQQAKTDSQNFNPGSFGFNASPEKKEEFTRLERASANNPKFVQTLQQFKAEIGRVNQLSEQYKQISPARNNIPVMASKTAQSIFPVKNAADLANKLMPNLITNDPDTFANTANYILSAVKGEVQEEEINSMIEALKMLDPKYQGSQDEALRIFGEMYNILPNGLKMPSMESNAMNNPKGIIKFDLSDHVLNNKTASCEGVTKTAADQFGQQYLLYGPTEKRICPKLRGKGGGQPGSGDVVSEYICRHHCLDGIVIDDNKTICGEALWRANVMDKYSREYVNEDGDITGGYLNKRFIIERNTPEENKMRLKPGETRKPRPPAWGSLESRMQDMRKKEADKRGYRPDSNKGDPFEWCHDVDQNNVEQSQSTRNKRETNSGHQIVKQEKSASNESFNLRKFAQKQDHEEHTCQCGKNKNECKCKNPADTGESYIAMLNNRFRGSHSESKFNLAKKMGQLAPVPLPEDGARSDRFLEDPKQRSKPMITPGKPNNNTFEDILPDSKSDSVVVPGGDVVDSEEAEKRKLKDLGMELMDWNKGQFSAIYQAASNWAIGNKAEPKVIRQALKELEDAINPEKVSHPDAITDEMAADARQLMEKIKPYLSGQTEEPNQMPKSMALASKSKKKKDCKCAFNLKGFKEAQVDFEREKFNYSEGRKRISQKSNDELQFMLKDLNEVISIQEPAAKEGTMDTPKLGYYYDERFAVLEEMKRRGISPIQAQAQKIAKSPPGWSGTVEKMKEHRDISNPFALAWWMDNKGNKPHYTEDGEKKDNKDNNDSNDSNDSKKKS